MMKMEKRSFFIVFVVLTALLFHHSVAHGQKPVRVHVRLILASNDPGFSGGGSGLQDLLGNLRSLFKYKGYKLISSSTATVSSGSPTIVGLAYGTQLEISSAGGGDNGRSLAVTWLQPSTEEIVSTQVKLWSQNPVLIGGPAVKDGTLILAISLRD